MSSDSNELQDALCILHGFSWPIKVQMCSGNSDPLDGTIETKRIRLYPRDLKHILEETKAILGNASDELLIPAKCLIPGISVTAAKVATPTSKKGLVKLFDNYYHQVLLENVTSTDMVTWAPPPFPNSRSELFPCTLYFVGTDSVHTSLTYAFVCPRKTIGDVSLSSKQRKCGKVPGWGAVYRVPLTEIYRWEDINQTQRLISTELNHVLMVCEEKFGGKHRYELIYKIKSSEEGLKAKNVKYPNVDEIVPDKNSTTDPPRPHQLKEGGHLTQEKVSKESLGDTSDQTEIEVRGGLVRANSNSIPAKGDPLHNLQSESEHGQNYDDRDQIMNGNVSNLTRQFSKQDSSGESSTRVKDKKTWNDESRKVILFGWCFLTHGKVNELQEVDGIKLGHVVVASPYHGDQDDILGKVSKICEIPSLRPKQIFVGVKFEEKVMTSPFEVRHVWGEENGECHTRCQGGKKVFIPIEHLLSTSSSSQSILRVLKETKDVKNTILTSDIKVDFNYESSRKDFLTTPINIDTIGSSSALRDIGIEGNANSCYIDSVLFALYAFTCNFDGGLIKSMPNKKHFNKTEIVKIEAAINLLKYDIVTQLRSLSKVSWVNVFKFRRALSEILNDKSYLGSFMDAETFITSLFGDILQVAEFFELGEDTKDYILQLFPPVKDSHSAKGDSRSSVQYLLEEYFGWAGVKLQKLPQVGFLIKLPVSDGVPHFKYTYPNLKLDLGKLLEKKGKAERFMNLRAVICLKTNHFTCFVRNTARSNEGKPVWLFHDSMAKEVGGSILTMCPHLETALEIASPLFDRPPGKQENLPEEAAVWLNLLLKTAYICVYEPVTSQETQL